MVLATTVGSVVCLINTCTPATCVGPVLATFETNDCTGTPVYQPMNEQFGVCEEQRLHEKTASGFISYYFELETCDLTASNASYSFEFNQWGACMPQFSGGGRHSSRVQLSAMAGSSVHLESVNDTVTPFNFDNQDLPIYQEVSENCFSPNNCTLPTNGQAALFWMTFYHPSAENCADPRYSIMNAYENFGVCMNFYNQSYVKTACFDSKGYYTTYYKDAACTEVISGLGGRSICTTSPYDYTCNAPITPLFGSPQAAPTPSAASSFQLYSLVVMAALSILFAF